MLLDRPEELYALHLSADADSPADHPHTRVSREEWRRGTLEHPDLDPDGSVLVLAGERAVAFAWLLVDRESGRAENEMTGTAPELRGQRLATLAKLAAAQRAAENGVVRLFTGNDEQNAAMLAINRRLGYRQIAVVTDWSRETQ